MQYGSGTMPGADHILMITGTCGPCTWPLHGIFKLTGKKKKRLVALNEGIVIKSELKLICIDQKRCFSFILLTYNFYRVFIECDHIW